MDQFSILARVAEIIEYHHELIQRNGQADRSAPLGAATVSAAIRQALRESEEDQKVVRKKSVTT